jgi:hypothetical protein
MNNFWFTWANHSNQFHHWSFLDGGNFFELPPHSSRVEENQYDLGDRINISVSHKLRVTLVLGETGRMLEAPAQFFELSQDPFKKTVRLACTATVLAN